MGEEDRDKQEGRTKKEQIFTQFKRLLKPRGAALALRGGEGPPNPHLRLNLAPQNV